MLRLFLFGAMSIERDGYRISDAVWTHRKAKNLLQLLALRSNHRLHKEHIIAAFWPDMAEVAANRNFYRTLHFLRHALEPELARPADSHIVTYTHNIVALEPVSGLWIDLEVFENLITQSRTAANPIPVIEQAVQMYRGDVLEDEPYEDWAIGRRESALRAYIGVLLTLAVQYRQDTQYAAAITTLHTILACDPTHEVAYRELMRSYWLSGQRHQALRVYQRCIEVLVREFDVAPMAETTQLYHDIMAMQPSL